MTFDYKYDVSVIIPLYNISDGFLNRCLTSIFANEGNYEVLLVDDGSEDYYYNGYVELYKHYLESGKKIQLIRGEINMGCFLTRMIGVFNSKGRIILPVDPDDWISPNAIEELSKAETDVIFFHTKAHYSNGETEELYPFSFFDEADTLLKAYIHPKPDDCGFLLAYSRECIKYIYLMSVNNIDDYIGINFMEDIVLTVYCLNSSEVNNYSFSFIQKELYNADYSFGSNMTSSFNAEGARKVIELLKKKGMMSIYKKYLPVHYSRTMTLLGE